MILSQILYTWRFDWNSWWGEVKIFPNKMSRFMMYEEKLEKHPLPTNHRLITHHRTRAISIRYSNIPVRLVAMAE